MKKAIEEFKKDQINNNEFNINCNENNINFNFNNVN